MRISDWSSDVCSSDLSVIPMSGGQTEKQVRLIYDFGAKVIMVTPSYFCNILEEMDRQSLDPRASALKIGIFGAEPWTDEMRGDIERRSGIDAVDIHGLSEVMGPGRSDEQTSELKTLKRNSYAV